ncbi:hypothetical protein ISS30_00855 [bacterium]|nr:hypothetical protein [bacterium]
MFPAGFKGRPRDLPGIYPPLYTSRGGLKRGRNTKVDLLNIIVMTSHYFYLGGGSFKK